MTEMKYHTLPEFDDTVPDQKSVTVVTDIKDYSEKNHLSLDQDDIDYYNTMIDRQYNDIELYDLAQSNSEHSRHWFF